jgi:hypothetical protein
VLNANGQDSAFVITNNSQLAGTCTLYFPDLVIVPQPPIPRRPFATPLIRPGEPWRSLLSTLSPGVNGCLVASCRFQPAEAEFAVFPYGATQYQMQKAKALPETIDPGTIDASCKFVAPQ